MDEEETPLPSLDKLASVPVHVRGAQERQRDLENVLNWIRQGRPVSEDPTGEFTKIEMMLPHVKGEKPRERAQKIEKAIDWVRNKGILPLHDASILSIALKFPSVSLMSGFPCRIQLKTSSASLFLSFGVLFETPI